MRNLIIILILSVFIGCAEQSSETKIIVLKNTLEIPRLNETVEISKSSLGFSKEESFELYGVKNMENNTFLTTQFIDEDADGNVDVLLFQPMLKANSEAEFQIVKLEQAEEEKSVAICYSRFVPERTDDYAWENNKVGFRTFGPTAQKMIEENVKGGTLTSGIDAWLKKVEYPIINKWYQKATNGEGTYHEDTGEGLDNFHVGISRGVGGVAVKVDTSYYFSKNFSAWKTISTGPIRTSFILTYKNWDAAGNVISEEKHISLDYGSNLSKFEISITGTNQIATGLTLHENDGEATVNKNEGWLSYWQPHGDSELGTGIVAPKELFVGSENYVTKLKDASNLYAFLKVENQKVIYYAGFGWKEAGEFKSKDSWNAYLQQFAKKVNNPIQIQFK
ncbi:DUF4861 domain-containing protein [Lutibacter holmesii]|uniref:DUF4861 domain-containing protein n=1 Tax=Lutibacter holmesii TaxID=1137985 RepID=A0ABW3WSY9_9FLAO